MKDFLNGCVPGLETVKNEALKTQLDSDTIDTLYKLFILLYADDTAILAESPESLQLAIDAMYNYCLEWDLQINVSKTKVVVFSKGKIRNLPTFTYNGQKIDVIFDFQYLGIQFNYNGSFKLAQKSLYDRATKAMYALLKKIRKLMLPIDVQIELFESTVVPILLYSSEVWCPQLCDFANKLQLRFLKMILKLNKSTPTCMVLGEVGQFPIEIQAKCRMLNYWFKLAYSSNVNQLSVIVYKFLYKLYEHDLYKCTFLESVKSTLDNLGLSHYWGEQKNGAYFSINYFKLEVKKQLQDQYVQQWLSEIDGNELYFNYRMYKERFEFEKYLLILPEKFSKQMLKFRTLNHKLPIQKGRFLGIPRNKRICEKCSAKELGDEFHYLFNCSHFSTIRKDLIKKYYYQHPNSIKYSQLLNNQNKTKLLKLSKFIQSVFHEI